MTYIIEKQYCWEEVIGFNVFVNHCCLDFLIMQLKIKTIIER